MGGSSFDLIMQEVFNQKQRLDELVEENQDLQRRLADLRAGRGIFLEIGDQPFALNAAAAAAAPGGVELPAQEAVQAAAMSAPLDSGGGGVDALLPRSEQLEDNEPAAVPFNEEREPARTSFLEDLLVDEFATAATSPMLTRQGYAAPAQDAAAIDEEAKATLRRELIGSFLLE